MTSLMLSFLHCIDFVARMIFIDLLLLCAKCCAQGLDNIEQNQQQCLITILKQKVLRRGRHFYVNFFNGKDFIDCSTSDISTFQFIVINLDFAIFHFPFSERLVQQLNSEHSKFPSKVVKESCLMMNKPVKAFPLNFVLLEKQFLKQPIYSAMIRRKIEIKSAMKREKTFGWSNSFD